MQSKLDNLKREVLTLLEEAGDREKLERIKTAYLGRKGKLTQILRSLSSLPAEKRPLLGKLANQLKEELLQKLAGKEKALGQKSLRKEKVFDPTLHAPHFSIGKEHPITKTIERIVEIFLPLGFQVVTGPEIETDYYNFEALNFPADHPARDEQDSFQIDDKYLLRTQTSPVQIRVMEKEKPPIRIIAPGRCYRRDTPDASHLPMFHQVEGLAVDTSITFTDLKGVLEEFVHHMFGEKIKMRLVPSFFPFTEPSAEVAISCIMCKGKGCRTCSQTGWLEILGAGMVHPHVFQAVNYDPKEYSGLAFGMGVERIAMLKYGIEDIRLFYENDLRFLRQF